MATPGVSRLFVDTNILVYATNADSPWQGLAENTLNRWRSEGTQLCLSVQVLREYLAVTTRPAVGQTVAPDYMAILDNLAAFRGNFSVLDDNRFVSEELARVVQLYSVQGRQVHDANIAATLRVHGIRDLLTHNTADFERYASFLTVHPLVPATTASGAAIQ